jgi:hypothetical protein
MQHSFLHDKYQQLNDLLSGNELSNEEMLIQLRNLKRSFMALDIADRQFSDNP